MSRLKASVVKGFVKCLFSGLAASQLITLGCFTPTLIMPLVMYNNYYFLGKYTDIKSFTLFEMFTRLFCCNFKLSFHIAA